MEYVYTINSPVGMLTVASDGQNICGLWIEGQKYFPKIPENAVVEQKLPIFERVREWLAVYFSGREPDFMPPLVPTGSPFQRSIWKSLCKIPYGKTASYGELARRFAEPENGGKQTSARAVGGAVGRNPISILIPCHRVLGSNGAPTGYAGGIAKKLQLLKLEGIDPAGKIPVLPC